VVGLGFHFVCGMGSGTWGFFIFWGPLSTL